MLASPLRGCRPTFGKSWILSSLIALQDSGIKEEIIVTAHLHPAPKSIPCILVCTVTLGWSDITLTSLPNGFATHLGATSRQYRRCRRSLKTNFRINLFQEKMSFTGETSTIEKDAKYRSETKNIQFLAAMFILYSKRLVTVKTN